MKDVAGKTAFVTGGASGMGLGMAKAFAAAVFPEKTFGHFSSTDRAWAAAEAGGHAGRCRQ